MKMNNFHNALQRLKEAVAEWQEGNTSDVVRDGLIQRFEFTYELAWKTTKEYLEEIGIMEINSPKAVFKEAFAQKLISGEDLWLLMIKDRNMTSHLYQEQVAQEIAERIKEKYVQGFEELYRQLSKDR